MPRPRKPARLAKISGSTAWYILYHDGNRDSRCNTGTSDRSEAEAFFARWLTEHGQPVNRLQSPDSLSVARLISTWLEQHAANKVSAARDAQAAEFLLNFWGERVVADITPETLGAYARWRRQTGRGTRIVKPATEDSPAQWSPLSDTTIRLELATLRAALKWHVKHGLLTRDPPITMPPKPAGRDRWLTFQEAVALVRACKESYLRRFVLLALYTGARKQAILELRWVQVDLERRLIHLNPPGRRQTSKGRPPVPIADPLYYALRGAKAKARTPWVIELTEEQASRIKAESRAPVGDVKKGFAAACKRAGLKDVTPHTLRHTCGSWLAQAGVPMIEIAAWLGHSHSRTTELYAHLSPEHLRGAAAALAKGR